MKILDITSKIEMKNEDIVYNSYNGIVDEFDNFIINDIITINDNFFIIKGLSEIYKIKSIQLLSFYPIAEDIENIEINKIIKTFKDDDDFHHFVKNQIRKKKMITLINENFNDENNN